MGRIQYLLDGVDSNQSQYVRARDDTWALFLQLLLDVVDHEKVPNTKVDSRVLLGLVHVGGVDQNRSITPLHEAVMEKQTQLRSGTGRIEREFRCHSFLHNPWQLRTRPLIEIKFQRRCNVPRDISRLMIFSQTPSGSWNNSKVSFCHLREYEKGHKKKQQNHGHNITSYNKRGLHCSRFDHDSTSNHTLKKISMSSGSFRSG